MVKLVIGFALMVAGFLAFAHEALTFISQLQWLDPAAIEQSNPLPLSPAFGAVAMFIGFVLIALQKEKPLRTRS